MRRRSRKGAWRGAILTLPFAFVAACSGSGKSFFDAPPLAHAGAGNGGTAGAPPRAGAGGQATSPTGSGGTAGGSADGAGATAGEEAASGGSPDAMAGAGDVTGSAGDESAGATGGATSSGGRGGTTAAGGATSLGGTGGDAVSTGGTTGGASGSAGTGGSAIAGGGGVAGGGAGTDASGGVAGTAGLGGFGAFAGAGTGGSATCVPTVPPDEICDGIDNDCHGGIDDQGVCPAGCVGAVDSDHRYLLCTGPGDTTYSRLDAHTACGDDGDAMGITLDLVRVNSAEEEAFLLGLIAANHVTGGVWNGASDSSSSGIGSTEGTWVWGSTTNGVTFYKDGAPVMNRYNDWAPGEPDNGGTGTAENCAIFDPALDWQWNDVNCLQKYASFICEEPTTN